jgi:formate dehydrogenase major subunit
MPDVHITIDGRELTVPRNSTILQAARSAGIDIPTLCDHPAIKPIGACRMCLVEVEKQRTLQPACTFPVSEGMVVHTASPAVVETRKFVLQLLLSERNHYCMYCQMSGDCELQNLAYRYGLDKWLYPRPYTPLPVDASRKYFVMDHNRCILCRRCVRACHELVGNRTLGLGNRGAKTMIVADMNVPFGKSSCISCGTCLQVCPTGALMDRRSAYRGRETDVERIKSTCIECSVGCGIELVVRANQLLRIEGNWEAAPNKGLLCVAGRFDPLYEERQRIVSPLVRQEGKLRQATWEDALDLVGKKLTSLSSHSLAFLASSRATNEIFQGLIQLAQKLGGQVYPLHPMPEVVGSMQGSIPALDEADLFVVVGTDLALDHQVVGMAVKRGIATRNARLVLVGGGRSDFSDLAQAEFSLDQVDQALAFAQAANTPAVIYGSGMEAAVTTLRRALHGKAQFLALAPGSNTCGAMAAGIQGKFTGRGIKGLYALVLDDHIPSSLVDELTGVEFLVVQASYKSPLVERADVVLPATIWAERSGTIINTEGCRQAVCAGLKPPAQVKEDLEVLQLLASCQVPV